MEIQYLILNCVEMYIYRKAINFCIHFDLFETFHDKHRTAINSTINKFHSNVVFLHRNQNLKKKYLLGQ